MKTQLIGAAILVTMTAAPAAAMNVQLFLTKAEALKRKGPLALFSGDLKLLMNQVQTDLNVIKAENAAKRPASYCAPAKGVSVNDKDVLQAMYDVPSAKRSTTQSKDALKAYFSKRYPCSR